MLSPRGQSDLEAKILASASKLLHRPQTFGPGLASISLSYYVIGHFSAKNRVKFGNFVNISGNNLKAYVVNHYLVRQLFGTSLYISGHRIVLEALNKIVFRN